VYLPDGLCRRRILGYAEHGSSRCHIEGVPVDFAATVRRRLQDARTRSDPETVRGENILTNEKGQDVALKYFNCETTSRFSHGREGWTIGGELCQKIGGG
jgi:hypothetical protein